MQREQLDRTLAEQRTRTLNESFATAAAQPGIDKPPGVRLAGLYAMAGVAETVDRPGILEALILGRMQGHGGTAEVPQGPEVKAGAAVSTSSGGFQRVPVTATGLLVEQGNRPRSSR